MNWTILQSRKFWALLAAVVGIAAGYGTGQVPAWESVQALVAATATFALATGIEDGLSRSR